MNERIVSTNTVKNNENVVITRSEKFQQNIIIFFPYEKQAFFTCFENG